jgi:uncharacterized membrane protein YphA (DoxX/SURF4 family)
MRSPHYTALWVAQALVCLFFAITFLHSGLEKVSDWRGNLASLKGHFAQSPLARHVEPLLLALTALEVASGAASVAGLLQLLFGGGREMVQWAFGLSGLTLVCMLFGQRMAKDHAGAAVLVPYFATAVLGLLLLR